LTFLYDNNPPVSTNLQFLQPSTSHSKILDTLKHTSPMIFNQAFLLFSALTARHFVDAFPLDDLEQQHSAEPECAKITCPPYMPTGECDGMWLLCRVTSTLGSALGFCQQCEESKKWVPYRLWTAKEASYYGGFGHMTSLNPYVDDPPFLDGPAPPRHRKSL